MGDDNVTAWALLLNKDNDGHCLFDCWRRLLQDLWETAKAFISSIIHSHFGFCCFYSLLPFCYWLSLLTHLLHPLSHAYLNILFACLANLAHHLFHLFTVDGRKEKKRKGTKYFTCMRCYASPHTCHLRRLLAMWAVSNLSRQDGFRASKKKREREKETRLIRSRPLQEYDVHSARASRV